MICFAFDYSYLVLYHVTQASCSVYKLNGKLFLNQFSRINYLDQLIKFDYKDFSLYLAAYYFHRQKQAPAHSQTNINH